MSSYNKWVIWGAKNAYNTFGHIFQAFERALRFMGKEVYWFDNQDDTDQFDFSGSIFLSMNCVIYGMPKRKDCLYVIHNVLNDPSQSYFDGLKLLAYGIHVMTNRYETWVEEIGPDIYFDSRAKALSFYWGTDLLPHEIDAHRPDRVWNPDSKVFNYVGTIDPMKRTAIDGFVKACRENGIEFRHWGGYSGGPVVSIEEHIRLIKESYISPAFQGADQVAQGYISCRIFKNLSYGHMTPVHSKYVNELFGGNLIYNDDTYALFHQAKERLAAMPVSELHQIMDTVAQNHTYLNKIRGIEQAITRLESE